MDNMVDIMYTYIILYNMIVADEGPEAGNWFDPENPGKLNRSASVFARAVVYSGKDT